MPFQSTPPRGRRLLSLVIAVAPANFNPRLREGGDHVKVPFGGYK